MNPNINDFYVRKILEFSDPYLALREKVIVKGNSELRIGNNVFKTDRTLIIAVGKASVKMAKFFIERLNYIRSIVIKPFLKIH